MEMQMAVTVKEDVLWMLVRTDDAGNNFLVGEGLTKSEAEEKARGFEVRGHKQTWHTYQYTASSRNALIKKHRMHL
jgi:hypothetical protein